MITRFRHRFDAASSLRQSLIAHGAALLIALSSSLVATATPTAAQGHLFSAPQSLSSDLSAARSVRAVDLDRDGDLDVVATTSGNTVAWFENTAGDGSAFSKHVITSVDGNAPAHDVGDIDGDGVLDVVVAKGSVGDVFWYRRSSHTSTVWSKLTVHAGSTFPADVHLADMDADGDLDVVVADSGDDRLVWYANTDGVGTTWTEGPSGLLANGASTVEVADLDGDGDLDLLTAVTSQDLVRWWRNDDGAGGAWTSVDYDIGLGGPWSVRAGDLDSDGDIDMVVNSIQEGVVRLENLGGPVLDFDVTTLDATFGASREIKLIDIDQDSDLDIVAVSQGDNELALWENTGQRAIVNTVTGWRRWSLSVDLAAVNSVDSGDLDGDGDLDLITSVPFATDNLVWLRNETPHPANGPEAATASIELLASPPSGSLDAMAFGDIDGDGTRDVVSGGSAPLSWWSGPASAAPGIRTQIQGNGTVFNNDIQVADLDGDGDPDVVSTKSSTISGNLDWWENQDQGANWQRRTLGTNVSYEILLIADLFSQGKPSVLVAGSDPNTAVRAFTPPSITGSLITSHGTNTMAVGDLDLDGDLDLVAGGDSSINDSGLKVAEQTGSGFTDHDLTETPIDDLELFDWDQDGDLDILAVSASLEQILFFENPGTGFTFIEHDITPVLFGFPTQTYDEILVGDFDRDGSGDLWVANTVPQVPEDERPNLVVLRADGSSADAFTIDTHLGIRIEAADIDHDGVDELMIFDQEANSVSSLLMPARSYYAGLRGQGDYLLERGVERLGDVVSLWNRSRPEDGEFELRSVQMRLEWRPPGWPAEPAEVLNAQDATAIVQRVRVFSDDGDHIFEPDEDTLLLDLTTLPYDGDAMVFELPPGSAPASPFGRSSLFITVTPRYSAPNFEQLFFLSDAEPEVFQSSTGAPLRRGLITQGERFLVLRDDPTLIFADGFEQGTASEWSTTTP